MRSITKKITLGVSLLGLLSVYVFSNPLYFGICTKSYKFGETVGCIDEIWDRMAETLFFVAPLILVFSLITFWMKEEVFQRWFRFAAWYVPLLVVATFIFPLSVPGGLGIGGAYQEMFNALVLIVLFSAFVIVSIVKIIRARKLSSDTSL